MENDLQDALSDHGVGLLIDTLDIPEALFLGFRVGSEDNRDDVELEPEA